MTKDKRLLSERFARASKYHPDWIRVVGRRRATVQLMEPVISIPAQYEKKSLLRGSD
jgi:hypothetical protein